MLSKILEWSEVWASMLPIIIWLRKRPTKKLLFPIIIYLWLALILNFLIDETFLEVFRDNNHLVYNILSVTRLFLFMQFFSNLGIPSKKFLRKIVFFITGSLIIIFALVGSINFFNSQIFALEAIVLISYSIIYFLKVLRSEATITTPDGSLLIVTGLLIYESCCFFLFLFYADLIFTDAPFAIKLWNVHNIVYIVLCLYISRAFFESPKYEFIKS